MSGANRKGLVVLIAASLLSAVLGSVHAFSVFLEPLETMFGAARSDVSLSYSFALMTLTFAVLMGHRVFAGQPAGRFVLGVSMLGAGGALLAGQAGSLGAVWLGYSLLFGGANGLGYGFGLQIAAQANPGRKGLAMGVVTAAYALGAVVAPRLFETAVMQGGFQSAMLGLAAMLMAVGIVSAIMMRAVRARFIQPEPVKAGAAVSTLSLCLLWLGYFGGVVAGLMVIGHAAGIAEVFRPGVAVWLAPAVIAVCNLVGSLIGGQLADRMGAGRLLSGLPLLTVLALTGLAVTGPAGGLMICLGLVGFAYGGTIAAYPSAIVRLFGMDQSARIYGRVFTAWGAAGLAGPWFAGWLFDQSGDYRVALWAAAGFGAVSVLSVVVLFRPKANSESV